MPDSIVTQLQLRRGNRSQSESFIGAEGELTYNTEDKELRIHDGVTLGGNKISGCEVDNQTTKLNFQKQIQAQAVLDQNENVTRTWTGTKAEYDALPNKNPHTLYYINDDFIVSGSVMSGRDVGDIFYTARLDNDINGAVECNGATLDTTQINKGYNIVLSLLTENKLPYVSMAAFQTQVTTHGSCRCFGWDGEGNTQIRVPLLSDVFIEAGTAGSPSEYKSAGLPNITGYFTTYEFGRTNNYKATGAFYVTSSGMNGTNGQSDTACALNLDASRSNSIYGNSTTVQPPAVKYRAMIQLFNSSTDDGVQIYNNLIEDVDNVKTQINKKASMSDVLTLFETLYPVGSIYLGTQSTCPLETIISGSTWELVSAGRTLQGADSSHSAGSTIEAGAPNITGEFILTAENKNGYPGYGEASGAISLTQAYQPSFNEKDIYDGRSPGTLETKYISDVKLDASKSSAIYGKSTTIQPNAYVVNIWKRTA